MRQETRKALNQTAEYAARALHFLIADGKLALRDVTTALSRRKKLIKELKDRFTALETAGIDGTANARKAAPPKAAKRRPRKAARKAAKKSRALPVAARAKAGARSTAKAAGKVGKKATARSTRRKATTQTVATKAAASRKPTHRPGTGAHPVAVGAKTKKPGQTAATAAATEHKPRPGAGTESTTPTPAPTPRTEGRRLPKVANPEREGSGPAPRDWNQV